MHESGNACEAKEEKKYRSRCGKVRADILADCELNHGEGVSEKGQRRSRLNKTAREAHEMRKFTAGKSIFN